MADLNQSYDSAKSQINSIKSYKDISASAKKLKSSAGNSFAQSTASLNSSLENISNQQKRYLRDQPTSFDQVLELIIILIRFKSSSLKNESTTCINSIIKIDIKEKHKIN